MSGNYVLVEEKSSKDFVEKINQLKKEGYTPEWKSFNVFSGSAFKKDTWFIFMVEVEK